MVGIGEDDLGRGGLLRFLEGQELGLVRQELPLVVECSQQRVLQQTGLLHEVLLGLVGGEEPGLLVGLELVRVVGGLQQLLGAVSLYDQSALLLVRIQHVLQTLVSPHLVLLGLVPHGVHVLEHLLVLLHLQDPIFH